MLTLMESIRTFAPLGIRFWDAATDTSVDGGLRVTVGPADGPRPRLPAIHTRSGIYAFPVIPGLRSLTHPDRPAEEVEASMPPSPVLVRIQDPVSRFLPVLHRVELPLPERGPYRLSVGSPPTGPLLSPPEPSTPRFYLFPAASRRGVPGLAEVRSTLMDATLREPLAHAVVEVRAGASRHISFADSEGRILVMFPYPPVPTPLGSESPLADVGMSLRAQEWELEVRVFHDPDVLDDPFDEDVPELGSILAQRARPVHVWPVLETSPPFTTGPVEALSALLRFGETTTLRTDGSSVLLVESQPSPPA